MKYIHADDRITDVVIVSATDVTDSLFRIDALIRALGGMPHVTRILAQLDAGDSRAAAELLPLVYAELRESLRLDRRHFAGQESVAQLQ